MSENPYVLDGVNRLRSKWEQSHFVKGRHGNYLIVVPSVLLPKGYNKTICTVLFIAPPGFPAACPADFFTDEEIRLQIPLEFNALPYHTHASGKQGNAYGLLSNWPQWQEKTQWWKWRLQMWNPNQSSLFSYMMAIRHRFKMKDPWSYLQEARP